MAQTLWARQCVGGLGQLDESGSPLRTPLRTAALAATVTLAPPRRLSAAAPSARHLVALADACLPPHPRRAALSSSPFPPMPLVSLRTFKSSPSLGCDAVVSAAALRTSLRR